MIKIIVITLIVLFSISCAFLIRPKVNFIIANNTSKDLNLKIFGKSKLLNSINIKSQSKFDTTVTYASPGSNFQNTPFDIEGADSVVVKFIDSKIIQYYCNGSRLVGSNCIFDKLPLLFETINSKRFKKYRAFDFDELDYQKAKPL